MIIPDKIKTFLKSAKDISFGYSDINFLNHKQISEEQVGYSFDTNGKSLVNGNDGDWQEEWLVIASDGLGDPVMVDTNSPNLVVLTASHGEGTWEPFIIADTLDNFIDIINMLTVVSKNRTSPVELEKNPISAKERQRILTEIRNQNPDTEMSYWESMFE